MQKIAIGLSALSLRRRVASERCPRCTHGRDPAVSAACVEYVAEYMGCINYGDTD